MVRQLGNFSEGFYEFISISFGIRLLGSSVVEFLLSLLTSLKILPMCVMNSNGDSTEPCLTPNNLV